MRSLKVCFFNLINITLYQCFLNSKYDSYVIKGIQYKDWVNYYSYTSY